MAEDGKCWGANPNPVDVTNIEEYGWDGSDVGHGTTDGWEERDTGNPADWSSALGELRMSIGDEAVSPVINKGDQNVKHLSITITGAIATSVQWRGRSTSFNQDDSNAVLAWEDYPTGGANKNWQYIQVKVKSLTIMQISGEDLQIDGVDIGLGG